MAAPIASGIAALMKAKNPDLPVADYVETLEDTGYPWECTRRGVPVKTNRIDAFCAVAGIQDCGLVNDQTDACQ